MGEFRDYLTERGLFKNSEDLNESPMSMDSMSFTKLRNEIQKKLYKYKFDIRKSEELEEIGKNIYVFSSLDIEDKTHSLLSGHTFIMYIENNIIIGAAMLQHLTINNGHNKKQAYEVLITTNFTKDKVPGLLYKLYSTFSKKYNAYIVSGDIQTPESRKIWTRWLREKENIKEIFGYHYTTKKYIEYKQISNFWCETERCKERRIVVKFK